jgi:hypothetical protein
MVDLDEVIGRATQEAVQSAAPSRDQLAAMAMQGLLSDGGQAWIRLMAEQVPLTVPFAKLAETAYAVADAMLAERAKKLKEGLTDG